LFSPDLFVLLLVIQILDSVYGLSYTRLVQVTPGGASSIMLYD